VKIRAVQLVLFSSLIAFAGIITINVINHRVPHYNGRSLDAWFITPTNKESIQAFKQAGAKSFPFLLRKLNGDGQFAACSIIEEAFQGSQIENSQIEGKLRTMLTNGLQGEQLEAYTIIRKFGLKVSDLDIAIAAKTSPSIRASEMALNQTLKLTRLYSMTNSLDCAFIAQLCNDSDPQIQMQLFSFLYSREKSSKEDSCPDQMIPAVAILVKNTSDASVLRTALSYISMKPQRIRNNLNSINSLLESTSDGSLQLLCESMLAALPEDTSLPQETRRVLELLQSRPSVGSQVRREAGILLAKRSSSIAR